MRSIIVAVLVLLTWASPTDSSAQMNSAPATAPGNSVTFPMPFGPPETRAQLLARLAHLQDPALRRRYHLLIDYGAPLFPPDDQIMLDTVRRGGLYDGLERWLRLEPARRRFDLLILPDVDYFWPADLHVDGYRPRYSTAFILHLEPTADGKTTVQILQINCMARFGKKFELLGRTGPKLYWDDRPVSPSLQAAQELVEHLTRAVL